MIGQPPPPGFSYRGFRDPADRAGTWRTTATLTDFVDRIISYRRVAQFPLVVMSTLAVDDVLAGWRRDATYYGGASVVLVLLIAALAWAVLRELARREQVEGRFAGLVANIPGAVYRRRQADDGKTTYPWISQGVHELLGWTQGEIARDCSPMINAIHADDQGACHAAHVELAEK